MLKILVVCMVVSFTSTSASLALAAEVATPKVAGTSLQKVNFTAQKSIYNQLDRVSIPAQDRAIDSSNNSPNNSPKNSKVMPEKAQLGLLLTALFCFVVRASRRKV